MLSLAPSHFWLEFESPMRNKHDQRVTSYHHNNNNFDTVANPLTTVEGDISPESSGEEESSVAEQSSGPRTSNRLPPRSRTGCWTCRRRKVKCDEKHPVCGQCLRLQQVCDYEPHFEFRYDTNKQRAKRAQTGIDEAQSPPWDRRARRPFDPRTSRHDDMPTFRALNSEEERERKAAFYTPGTYHVVADQNSFAALPEYGGTSPTPEIVADNQSTSTQLPIRPPQRRQASLPDPNLIVLERFETPSDRPMPTSRQQQRQQEEQQSDRQPRSHSQPLAASSQPLLHRAATYQHHHQHPNHPREFYNMPPNQGAFGAPHTGPAYGAQYYTASQLGHPGYGPVPPGYAQLPFRRSYTQSAVPTTGEQYVTPVAHGAQARHLSMSLTSGSGSVLEEISGMRGMGYMIPKNEESIEDWEDELYGRQG